MTLDRRILIQVVGVVLLALLVIGVLWAFDPLGRRKRAELRADRAEAAQRVTAQGAAVSDQGARNTAAAIKTAEEAKDEVVQAPNLDSALSRYGAGIDGVRQAGRAAVVPAERKRRDAR